MSHYLRASRLFPLLAFGLSAAAFNACSATPGQQIAGAGATGGNGGEIDFDAGHQGDSGTGLGGSEICAAEPHVAVPVPLDMFIMLDQSDSMSDAVAGGGSKWAAVTDALTTFVDKPGLAGVNVGIQYFGQPPGPTCLKTCATDAECGGYAPCSAIYGCMGCAIPGDSCNPLDYSTADVEIAPLPGVASDITFSMFQHGPSTSTPTSAALQGGLDHCKVWATAHPGHVVVQVFATDGIPGECDTSFTHINAIAASGAKGSPKVLTFVIGVGSSLTALNDVAASGGTGQAYIVDTDQDANQQFLVALNAIRGAALGCEYDIPVPTQGTPDPDKVNVQYTPSGGGAVEVFDHYLDQAHCPAGGDGWYYDDNQSPTLIHLCDATCTKVGADTADKIDILLGCKTKIPG